MKIENLLEGSTARGWACVERKTTAGRGRSGKNWGNSGRWEREREKRLVGPTWWWRGCLQWADTYHKCKRARQIDLIHDKQFFLFFLLNKIMTFVPFTSIIYTFILYTKHSIKVLWTSQISFLFLTVDINYFYFYFFNF